jgi:hypothetical protein
METVSSLGLPSARLPCLAPMPRMSIMLWSMRLLSVSRFDSYFRNFIDLSARPLLSTATRSPLSTCQPIQCNIVTPSILRSTYISFERRSLLAKFGFSMFPQPYSFLMSWWRDCRVSSSSTFRPISASENLRWDCGGVRLYLLYIPRTVL